MGELAAALKSTGNPTRTVEGVAVGPDVKTGRAVTVITSVAVPVPLLFVAPRVTEVDPVAAASGVPEIKPVVVLTVKPLGSPVALKLVGVLLAVI
jgi:hypothetical protein